MLVMFHSDSRWTEAGFAARWNSEKNDLKDTAYNICKTSALQFSGDRIQIISPDYSFQYPNNKNCVLQFNSLPDTIFKVEFFNFYLQFPNKQTNKCYDYLSIRDGDHESSNELIEQCGRSITKSQLFTTANKIYLHFKSDNTVKDRGFQIYISTVKKPLTNVSYFPANQCGQHINGNGGVLTNPSHEHLSTDGSSTTCIWIIESQPTSYINFKISNVDLSGSCDTSYLLVRDGTFPSSPIIAKYCNDTAFIQRQSSSNKIWVEYKTPANNIGHFVMKWTPSEVKVRFISFYNSSHTEANCTDYPKMWRRIY